MADEGSDTLALMSPPYLALSWRHSMLASCSEWQLGPEETLQSLFSSYLMILTDDVISTAPPHYCISFSQHMTPD